ncbi:MAG: nucleic acid-binding protein [Halobacteriales archaeon]
MGSERLDTAVVDAGPIIHLGKVDSLSLLSIFNRLVIPEAVVEEVSAGGIPESLNELKYDVVEGGEEEEYSGLDRGEAVALSVVGSMDKEVVFLTDDLEAREQAKELGFEVHGSVGVIVAGFREDEVGLDDATSKIRALSDETEMFISDAVVEQGIKMLEELAE